MIPPFSSANSQQRLISPMGRSEDQNDNNIRPALLAEYIGQPVVKEQMGVFINAALSRKEALDHTLIFGPPGLDEPLRTAGEVAPDSMVGWVEIENIEVMGREVPVAAESSGGRAAS